MEHQTLNRRVSSWNTQVQWQLAAIASSIAKTLSLGCTQCHMYLVTQSIFQPMNPMDPKIMTVVATVTPASFRTIHYLLMGFDSMYISANLRSQNSIIEVTPQHYNGCLYYLQESNHYANHESQDNDVANNTIHWLPMLEEVINGKQLTVQVEN
jgi:hypothetical protein